MSDALRCLLAKHPRGMPEGVVRRLLNQVLTSLADGHARGVAHGDLRPETIQIDANGNVTALISDEAHRAVLGGIQRTRTVQTTEDDAAVRALVYAAPETIETGEMTPAADVYSMGVIVFELLTGCRPEGPWAWSCAHCAFDFLRGGYAKAGQWHPRMAALLPTLHRPDLPDGAVWDAICYWMTDCPEHRFATASAVNQALRDGPPPLPFAVGRDVQRLEKVERDWDCESVAITPERNEILAAYRSGYLRRWSLRTGQALARLDLITESRADCGRLSPDGQTVLLAGPTVELRSTETGQLLRRLTDPADSAGIQAAFAPDGRHVVTWSADGVVRVWEDETGQVVGERHVTTPGVEVVAVAPGGGAVVVCGAAKVGLWDSTRSEKPRWLVPLSCTPAAAVFSHDGRWVITAEEKVAWRWDIDTGTMVQRYEGHFRELAAVAFSPGGQHVLTGSDDGTARLWETATGREVVRFHPRGLRVGAVAFSPDARSVVTGTTDGSVHVWDSSVASLPDRPR